jgi:hypothetical protein
MLSFDLLAECEVLTLEEISSFLRVSKESLDLEINSGRLATLKIGSDVRILKHDFIEFLELAKGYNRENAHPVNENGPATSRMPGFDLQLEPSEPFSYKWPNGNQECYEEAYNGTIRTGSGVKAVHIGFAERASTGKVRKRAVVFIDKRPLVEFVGADDFEKSGSMLSLVKHKNGKQVRPGERILPEYKHLKIEPYNDYVTGPHASSNLAVVCSCKDLSVMVEHALLRLRKGGRR